MVRHGQQGLYGFKQAVTKEEKNHCKHEGFHKTEETREKNKGIKPTITLTRLNEGMRGFIQKSDVLCHEFPRVHNEAQDLT